MADFFQQLSQTIGENQIVIAIVIVAAAVLLYLVKVKKKPIVVSRAEVERDRRIQAVKFNAAIVGESVFKDLYHGRRWIGSIKNIVSEVDENKLTVLEIVFKPKLLWKLSNPLKLEIIRLYADSMIKDYGNGAIVIKPDVSTDSYFGMYYDMPHSVENRNFISSHLYKTDAESLGDMYFAESQKRATVDLDQAGIIEAKQMDLQIEREKRARLMSSG